jgi:hypothetical protein
MTTTTGTTHTPAADEDGPPAPEQLMAELVTWLNYMPAQRRALIASALVHSRWKLTLAAVCRQAVAELVETAQEQQVPHPYEHVARQLGVEDPDVDGLPIIGDLAEHMQRLVRKFALDGDAGIDPAVAEVGEAADSARRTGGALR